MKFLRERSGWQNVRDVATWGIGATIALVAFFRTGRIDYSLYPIIGGCLGLPFVFHTSDKANKENGR